MAGQPTGFMYALDCYLAVRVQNTYDGFGHNISIGGQEVDGSWLYSFQSSVGLSPIF